MKQKKLFRKKVFFIVTLLMAFCLNMHSQNNLTVKGMIVDSQNEPVIGASVTVKGNTSSGVISDISGKYTLTVPSSNSVIVFSYIGMKTQEFKVGSRRTINVILEDDNAELGEVVVVGYGQQKKASVVGSITQTTGETLKRAGGVNDIGAALTGNLPGVITSSSTGMPGDESPQIVIRSASSWNNSDPLVLVDGIEREMSSVDISSVESISVLKDASATAVYGVKGANGVILITTKRGKEGKANIEVKANITAKVASQLPKKYDAYDTFYLMNQSIEREAALNASGWGN